MPADDNPDPMSLIDLTRVVRPGDGVVYGQNCAEPQTLVEALVAQRASFSGARLFAGSSYSGILKPEHADHLRIASYCGSGTNRALAEAGVLDIYPAPYSQLGALIRAGHIKADVVLLQVAPPNTRGEYSLGLAVEYLAPALRAARAVVAEVNDQVPWTHTERLLRREDFALVVETSRPPVPMPSPAPREADLEIARHAAQFIADGAVLECGIGMLPNAVLAALGDRRGLGYHSGLAGDGVVALLESGAIAGPIVAGALMGTRVLFDWARENPQLLRLRSSDYTHAAAVLGKIERFVAINSAVEVDHTGQVNCEVAKGTYIGAVGGALDFVRAANQSPGGVSIIVLPASRIVKALSGPVSVPRSEAGVIVTEKGAADLRGCTLRERERRLRSISGNP
jgi:acetyl-CoA hydrolase